MARLTVCERIKRKKMRTPEQCENEMIYLKTIEKLDRKQHRLNDFHQISNALHMNEPSAQSFHQGCV